MRIAGVLLLAAVSGLGQSAELEPPAGLDESRTSRLSAEEREQVFAIAEAALRERGIELEGQRIFRADSRVIRSKTDNLPRAKAVHYRYRDDAALVSTVNLEAAEVVKFEVVPHKPVPFAEEEIELARGLAAENEQVRELLEKPVSDLQVEPLGVPIFGENDPLFGHRVVDLLFRTEANYVDLRVTVNLTDEEVLVGTQASQGLEAPPGAETDRARPLTPEERGMAVEIAEAGLRERGIEPEGDRIFEVASRLLRSKTDESRRVQVTHYRYEDDAALLSTVALGSEEVEEFQVVPHKPVPFAEAEIERTRELALENEQVREELGDLVEEIEVEPLGVPMVGENDPLFGHRIVDLLFRNEGNYVDLRVTVDLTEGNVLVR